MTIPLMIIWVRPAERWHWEWIFGGSSYCYREKGNFYEE